MTLMRKITGVGMKAVLVFIDGVLCDWQAREQLQGTPDFYKRENVVKDRPNAGSVRCMQELARRYQLVYIGARPESAKAVTEDWLAAAGFPKGPVFVAGTQAERLALVRQLKEQFNFVAGIGTRWSDNELHLEIGCPSIILKEFEANWDIVRKQLLGQDFAALQLATRLLTPFARATAQPEANRLDVTLDPGDLIAAVTTLRDANWGFLTAITGRDNLKAGARPAATDATLEVLYHFCAGAAIVTLRVPVARDDARVPSLCGVLPAAELFERELSEMFGITLDGAPHADRLLLPDDWPANIFPMRKDFDPTQMKLTSSAAEPEPGWHNGRFIVPIGPQHPALKEPGHFEFAVDGETVIGANVRLGYVHRGIERATEGRNWTQNLYLLERICGICSHSHAMAYALGVEKLAGVEAPPRAQAIRELAAGLERIHSHLLWLGVAAHEAGFDTLFMYSWRDRETVMDLLEAFTGNRVNYSVNVLGGVKFDVTDDIAAAIRRGVDFLEERTQHYLEVCSTDHSFLRRTRGVGTLTKEQAIEYGVVGPMARASGLARDVRVDAPYGAYHLFPVNVVVETAGDLEAKFIVRLRELFETYRAIRNILDHLPPGDLTTRTPRKIPAGETISRIEAPRGELFYYIQSDGGESPARVKVRTPTLCNFTSVMRVAIGHQLADMPMLLAGIDPCFSCNDRMVVINDRALMRWEQLRQYGIEYYRKRGVKSDE
jgi:NADH-quinone oxidoreductase subunit D